MILQHLICHLSKVPNSRHREVGSRNARWEAVRRSLTEFETRNGRSSISFGSGTRSAATRSLPSAAATARWQKDFPYADTMQRVQSVGRHDRSGRQARRPACHSSAIRSSMHRQFDGDVGAACRSDIAELFVLPGGPDRLQDIATLSFTPRSFSRRTANIFGRTQDSRACGGDLDCGRNQQAGSVSISRLYETPSRSDSRRPFVRSIGKLQPRSWSPRSSTGFEGRHQQHTMMEFAAYGGGMVSPEKRGCRSMAPWHHPCGSNVILAWHRKTAAASISMRGSGPQLFHKTIANMKRYRRGGCFPREAGSRVCEALERIRIGKQVVPGQLDSDGYAGAAISRTRG